MSLTPPQFNDGRVKDAANQDEESDKVNRVTGGDFIQEGEVSFEVNKCYRTSDAEFTLTDFASLADQLAHCGTDGCSDSETGGRRRARHLGEPKGARAGLRAQDKGGGGRGYTIYAIDQVRFSPCHEIFPLSNVNTPYLPT